jgi:hypothetical protein
MGANASAAAGIPLDAFAKLKVHCAWTEKVDANGRRTKVPYVAPGVRGSSTNASRWLTKAEAEAVAAKLPGRNKGIGIFLGLLPDGSGLWLIGFDFDTCRDPINGVIEPWALAPMQALGTYTETSPSDMGTKAYALIHAKDADAAHAALGLNPGTWGGTLWKGSSGQDHPPSIEAYMKARFFCVTGEHEIGFPHHLRLLGATDLSALAAAARALTADTGPEKGNNGPTQPGNGPDAPPGGGKRARDESRSARAFEIGGAVLRFGGSYEKMKEVLSKHPETADWYRQKGLRDGERQLKRIFDRTDWDPFAPSNDNDEGGPEQPKDVPPAPAAIWDPWLDPPPPAWPGDILPPPIEAALISIAARDGLDPGLLCCTALVGVSAAAHKGIRFIPYQPGTEGEQGLWSVPPIIWLVPIADSGFRKSRYDKIIFACLQDVARAEWQAYLPQHQGWQSLPPSLRRSVPEPPAPPIRIIDDFSYEGLRDALHGAGRGTALVVDELVGLLEFDRYKGGTSGANAGRGFLLSTFDDEPKNAVRAGNQYIHVAHTGCAMFGGIQRRRIAGLKGDLETDGFLQRMTPILIPVSAGSRPGTVIPPGINGLETALEELATDPDDPRTYRTTPAGSACIFATEEVGKLYGTKIFDYGAGWPGFAFKLHGLHARCALLLHLLEEPKADIIPTERVKRAGRLIHGFILQHARNFHGELLGGARDIHRDIAGWLLTRGPAGAGKPERILASDFTNNVRSCRDFNSRGIGEALDIFVVRGWLVPETNYPSNRVWFFDPAIRARLAARMQAEQQRRAAAHALIQRMVNGRKGTDQ